MLNLLNRSFSLKADYLLTAINGIAVLLSVLLLNGLIARMYGLEILGEFLLVRRTVFAMMGILLLGMNIGLPSLIGGSTGGKYEGSSLIIFIIYSLPSISIILYYLGSQNIAGYNSENVWAYYAFTIGVSSQYLIYSLYRGYLKMLGANCLHFLGTALIPILVFLNTGNLNIAMMVIGISILIVNIIAFIMLDGGMKKMVADVQHLKNVVRFGSERIVSFISQFVLLAGAPILISIDNSYSDLAYFNSLISLVRIMLFVVGPLGIVLLPRVSKAVEENNLASLSLGLNNLLKLALIFGGLIAVFLSSTGAIILELWLGTISSTGKWMAQVMLLSIPLYLIVEILRSPIDGLSKRGYNSIIYLISAIALIGSYYGLIYFGVSALKAGVFCFIIGYLFASVGSLIILKKLTSTNLPSIIFFTSYAVFLALVYWGLNLVDIYLTSFALVILIKLSVFSLLGLFLLHKNRSLIEQLNLLSKGL